LTQTRRLKINTQEQRALLPFAFYAVPIPSIPQGAQSHPSMASTSQPHSSFPGRPYASTLHSKLPERNPPSNFGATSGARLQQDRERVQRDAQPGPSSQLNALSEEQREEINEAVCRLNYYSQHIV